MAPSRWAHAGQTHITRSAAVMDTPLVTSSSLRFVFTIQCARIEHLCGRWKPASAGIVIWSMPATNDSTSGCWGKNGPTETLF